MKRFTVSTRLVPVLLLVFIVLAIVPAAMAQPVEQSASKASPLSYGKIIVANRADGTISVIDVHTDQVSATIPLPAGDNAPEPMYVVYTKKGNRVFVGDRANNRVVVFDADSFEVETTIAAGTGVFHMWANPQNKQLWVNNDIDKTSTVIDLRTLQVLATVPMPADLIAQGAKPHDVVLDTRFAYVSLLGAAGANDYVVKFDQRTFEEVGRAAVGKDPHVSLTLRNQYLYVPSQNSNVVTILDRPTLNVVTELNIPGAHGAGMTRSGKTFYTSNLTGGGEDALWAIDTRTNTVVGDATDAPDSVPHNIALTMDDSKLYLTHSGANNTVTVYNVSRKDPQPVYATTVTVGSNPFGLAFAP